MQEKEQVQKIKDCLAEFIIRSTKENAPSYAVQMLPEAVKSYIVLLNSGF